MSTAGETVAAPDYNLRIRGETLNDRMQDLRTVPREEILTRLRDDFATPIRGGTDYGNRTVADTFRESVFTF